MVARAQQEPAAGQEPARSMREELAQGRAPELVLGLAEVWGLELRLGAVGSGFGTGTGSGAGGVSGLAGGIASSRKRNCKACCDCSRSLAKHSSQES